MIRELIVLDVPPQVSVTILGSAKKLENPCRREAADSLAALVQSKFIAPSFLPSISDEQKKFPIDNLAEWNHNNNPLGLRSMQVYVLVFDMGNLDTFQVSTLTRVEKCIWYLPSFVSVNQLDAIA